MFDDEMMKAFEADGEKLKSLTGQDHGPHFIPEQPCEVCGGDCSDANPPVINCPMQGIGKKGGV